MTNKITKEFLFTELSIKIATLEMKLDKILSLLDKPKDDNDRLADETIVEWADRLGGLNK
jgi:hypothetical protein